MLLINVIILILALLTLFYMQKKYISFNKRVFFALILGACVGIFIHLTSSSENIDKTMGIYNIISIGYIRLLQMLIYPLVAIMIVYAMTKVGNSSKIAYSIISIISILLITTSIAACVGILISLLFNLDLSFLYDSAFVDNSILSSLQHRESLLDQPMYAIITSFIPTNPFADLAGTRSNSLAASMVFFMIIGIAYLGVKRKEPAYAEKFKNGVEVLYKIISRVVVLVLRLTPYGIFAIFTKILATTSMSDILVLIKFVGLSYFAMLIMFVIHSMILKSFGYSIINYYKTVAPLLLFSFVSRSSAAAIPMNINIQTKGFNIKEDIAATSASFGAIMGQNGCAGIYPAMLAVALAPTVGINPLDITFILSLILIIAISSFGIAGVGGGAIFAAIAVLSTFNMPIMVVALLVGIDPLIDMGRTALNVNGTVTSGLVTNKLVKD